MLVDQITGSASMLAGASVVVTGIVEDLLEHPDWSMVSILNRRSG